MAPVGSGTTETAPGAGGRPKTVTVAAAAIIDSLATGTSFPDQLLIRRADISVLPTRGQLEGDLRAVLQAAVVDGVITDPDARSNWS